MRPGDAWRRGLERAIADAAITYLRRARDGRVELGRARAVRPVELAIDRERAPYSGGWHPLETLGQRELHELAEGRLELRALLFFTRNGKPPVLEWWAPPSVGPDELSALLDELDSPIAVLVRFEARRPPVGRPG